MPAVDYPVLLDGLTSAGQMMNSGVGGLPVINRLVVTAQEGLRAAGATFTEYDDDGGRVVAAAGVMHWSLGLAIAPEVTLSGVAPRTWTERVELLPVQVAEPLLQHGLRRIAGCRVEVGGRAVGSTHVYYTDARARPDHPEVLAALGVISQSLAQLYSDHAELPLTYAHPSDEQDLFLAVTGHELRTPVTVIKGYASTLATRWDALDEKSRQEAVFAIAQRSDELATLLDRLLSVSQGSTVSGWLTRFIPFDLVDALGRAAADLPAEPRQALRVDLPAALPTAYGDPVMLATVLGELVTNAIRHGGRGPVPGTVPEIELTAGADGQTVYFRVSDRGVGIDPAHVERAFDRFWQAERDADNRRGGVGLGLYLVRRLVERQKGWVSLRPRDGGGTVAEVRLPRADGH
jgi:signal transduction histidine kinase